MIVSVLRKEARENLKGKWKKAILMMLIFYVVTILVGTAVGWIGANTQYGMLAIILNIVITVALNYGLLASFIKLKRNENVNVFHFLYYAGRDVEKVWKNVGRLILKVLIYIILLLLFLWLTITELVSLYYGYGMRLSFWVEIIGFIVLCIILSMKMLYYSLMNYVLYDNKECKAKEILKESQRLMKNHRWDFIRMYLTFSGWFILAIAFSAAIILMLYFGAGITSMYIAYISYIPLIFLLPYVYTTTVCFYDNLVYNNPKPKDDPNNVKKSKKTKKKANKNK